MTPLPPTPPLLYVHHSGSCSCSLSLLFVVFTVFCTCLHGFMDRFSKVGAAMTPVAGNSINYQLILGPCPQDDAPASHPSSTLRAPLRKLRSESSQVWGSVQTCQQGRRRHAVGCAWPRHRKWHSSMRRMMGERWAAAGGACPALSCP